MKIAVFLQYSTSLLLLLFFSEDRIHSKFQKIESFFYGIAYSYYRKFIKKSSRLGVIIVCIWISPPPQKHHYPLFRQAPPPSLNLQTVQAPSFSLLQTIPPIY